MERLGLNVSVHSFKTRSDSNWKCSKSEINLNTELLTNPFEFIQCFRLAMFLHELLQSSYFRSRHSDAGQLLVFGMLYVGHVNHVQLRRQMSVVLLEFRFY